MTLIDPIKLAVFRSMYESIAEEMGTALQRAAFSPNIRERLDFSCAVFDAEARMIAQAAHIPVHLGSMPASVKAAVAAFDRLYPGDIVILNDPYAGGTHLPDITMVSPVFHGERLLFFAASRAHHADVGGMSPGSLPLSTELYQEGVIIPPIKLAERGALNQGVLTLLTANSRGGDERIGDFEAQIAAQRIGAARMLELSERYGAEPCLTYASALMDYAERMTRKMIASIPNGTYTFTDYLEGDGQRDYDIPIRVTLTIAGDGLSVDFTGTSPQTAGNLNAVQAVALSAVVYCLRLIVEEDIALNAGSFAPISLHIPEGSLLNPRFPAAVAVGNTETAQRVVDVVLGALAQALPDRIPAASQGSMNNITVGGSYQGKPFIYYETIGGGHGASLEGDGLSGRHSHMTNTRNTPIEALETSFPIRVLEYSLRENSGGDGQFRGGMGITRRYAFLTDTTATLNTERRRLAPYGLGGGEPGHVGQNRLKRAAGATWIGLPAKWTDTLHPGDQLSVETPGGGGRGTARQNSAKENLTSP